jgi:peptide/nickel transport system permease protein
MVVFRRNRLALVGVAILSLWILVALAAPLIATDNPNQFDIVQRLAPPGRGHWFGTDWLGRDVFSRVVYGARTTLFVGVVPIAIATVVGVPLGAIAGYAGGAVETTIMRCADVFLAVPALILAIATAATLGPSLLNGMIAIAVVWWPWYTRLVHAETLSLSNQPWVEAVYGLGATRRRILFRHILPNESSPLLVRISLDLGFAVLVMAGLSFVGLGAQPPSPEWGLSVSLGRAYMPNYWWISVFPGLAIFTLVLAFNLIGDGLRDALDPELRR